MLKRGFEVLEKLLSESRPLTALLREHLQMHQYYNLYCDCGERLHFERTTFEQFGRTEVDLELFRRHTAPILAQMNTIESHAIDSLRSTLIEMDALGLGIRSPMREPICYSPILPSTWAVLKFTFAGDEVRSDGIKFTEARVASIKDLSPHDRKCLEAIMQSEEARQTKRAREADAPVNLGSLADVLEKLSVSISNQSVSVSVSPGPVDVRLVDVHPDLVQRATNADASKASQPKSEPVAPAKEESRDSRPPGRPSMKRIVYRVQLQRWAERLTAQSCAKEAREIEIALKEKLKGQPQGNRPSIPGWESIENIIRHRYRRLQKMRNGIKCLMGVSPI
jgi:hypothetical protein